MTGTNAFELQAFEFLVLYAALFMAAVVAGFAIAAFVRPEGNSAVLSKDDELAYLAGGRARLGETVLARMLAAGQARIEKAKIHLAPTMAGAAGLERAILALPSPASFGKVQGILKDGANRIEHDLTARGLMMERAEAWQVGLLAALPLLLLLGLGLIRYQFGVAAGRPVGFLAGFMIVTAIFAAVRVFAVDRRTKNGLAVVKEAKMRAGRLKRAPTQAETGMAVALFGTAVLAGSPLADLHKMRQSDGGGGDGGSSSDGGDGCGGGGCGG
jgi:uncharacterized protein (TIGR04222 family)